MEETKLGENKTGETERVTHKGCFLTQWTSMLDMVSRLQKN